MSGAAGTRFIGGPLVQHSFVLTRIRSWKKRKKEKLNMKRWRRVNLCEKVLLLLVKRYLVIADSIEKDCTVLPPKR